MSSLISDTPAARDRKDLKNFNSRTRRSGDFAREKRPNDPCVEMHLAPEDMLQGPGTLRYLLRRSPDCSTVYLSKKSELQIGTFLTTSPNSFPSVISETIQVVNLTHSLNVAATPRKLDPPTKPGSVKKVSMIEPPLSLLDAAILASGLGLEAIRHPTDSSDPDFDLSDDPPTDAVLQQTIATFHSGASPLPQEDGFVPFNPKGPSCLFASEQSRLQSQTSERLLAAYQMQIEQLNGAEVLVPRSPQEQRFHFYLKHLIAVVHSPRKTAMDNFFRICRLHKLWQSRKLETEVPNSQFCGIPDCIHLAIPGSKFCGWHILHDPEQRLFQECPECGWPIVNHPSLPCRSHRRRSNSLGGARKTGATERESEKKNPFSTCRHHNNKYQSKSKNEKKEESD
jgi:hypothetical protein